MPSGGLDIAAGSLLAEGLGATAAGVVGDAALGAEVGGGLGGLESAIGGKSIGRGLVQGAELGGLTGGAGGAIGAAYDASGITTGIGDAINGVGNSISDGFDSAKDAVGLGSSSSSSITDAAGGAGAAGSTNAAAGAAAPGVSAAAAPDVANAQVSTLLGGSQDPLGATPTGFGSVAPSSFSADTSGIDASANNFNTATNAIAANSTGGAGVAPAAASGGSSLSKLAPLVPLGNLAYQAISGPAALPSSAKALEAGGAATAPLLATENQQLNEGNTGQLTPGQTATINNYTQNAKNQLIQQLASSGVTDYKNDSRYIQGMQQIQQQAVQQQQQYIQEALSAGISAGGAASGNIAGVANEQLSQDKEFQEALASATSAFGQIMGAQPNSRTIQ